MQQFVIETPPKQALANQLWQADVRPWERCQSLAKMAQVHGNPDMPPEDLRDGWSGAELAIVLDITRNRTIEGVKGANYEDL